MNLLLMLDQIARAHGDGLLPQLRESLVKELPPRRLEIVNMETVLTLAANGKVVLTVTDVESEKMTGT